MERGWIKVYRKMQDNPHYQRKPYDQAHAIIDMLLRATHKPYKKVVGYKTIYLEPGQFFTSIRNLAKDWGWSVKRVRNFLKALEDEKFLDRQGTEKGTTFTIINWGTYQDLGQAKGTQRAHLQEHKNIYKGTFFSVTEINHRGYEEAYPGVDLVAEYRKMDAWLQSNPKKRKKDYPRFVNNWLARAYEKEKPQEGNWYDAYSDLSCD